MCTVLTAAAKMSWWNLHNSCLRVSLGVSTDGTLLWHQSQWQLLLLILAVTFSFSVAEVATAVKSTGVAFGGFASNTFIGNVAGLSLVVKFLILCCRTLWPFSFLQLRISAICSLVMNLRVGGCITGWVSNCRYPVGLGK